MPTPFSHQKLVDSESCLSSQVELDHDTMSFARLYTGLRKIENVTHRLEYLSSFVSAIEETLEFFSTFTFIFHYCSKEIVGLAETARKTLESAGVVPYLWASCPERLIPHKRLYIQLLQLLHSNERDMVSSLQLRKRLRTLLMPLTSHFSISRNSDSWQHQFDRRTSNDGGMSARAEPPMYRMIHSTPELHEAGRDQGMPPPPAPPFIRTPISRLRSHGGKTLTRSIKRRLWTEDELLPPLNLSSRHRLRNRDTTRSRADSDDEEDSQENSAPEDGVPFRQPRAKLRFGICFNRKSSSQQNGGRVSNTHSLMNYKE
jgi:hypothetical protein